MYINSLTLYKFSHCLLYAMTSISSSVAFAYEAALDVGLFVFNVCVLAD